jgi:protein TonB
MKYALPEPIEARWEKPLRFAVIFGIHALLLLGALTLTLQPKIVQTLASLDLRVIEEEPVHKEPEKPSPPVPLPSIAQPEVPLPELPVFTTAAPNETQASLAVAPQPAPPALVPVAPVPVVASEPEPVESARFDADYLHNPAPAYPYASRRNHEEGRVVLMVLVSAEGAARSVRIHRGSGYPALDQAALEAVQQWKFVPARHGEEAVEDWVLVPLSFHLRH